MISSHPSILFAKRSPVSSGSQIVGTRLDFDKALNVLYVLGHLNLPWDERRPGKDVTQKNDKFYYTFTSALPFLVWIAVAIFYTVNGYEKQHCQIGKKLPNPKFVLVHKRISVAYWKYWVGNNTYRGTLLRGFGELFVFIQQAEPRVCSSVCLYLYFCDAVACL